MQKISEQEFKDKMATDTMLVCIGTNWCSNCRELHTRLDRIEAGFPQVTFVELDADTLSNQFLDEYGVDELPVLFVSTPTERKAKCNSALLTSDDNIAAYIKLTLY